jgi:hypothetical protein
MSDERKEENQAEGQSQEPLNTGMAEGLEELEAQAAQIAKDLQAAGDGTAGPTGEESKPENEKKTDPKPNEGPEPKAEKPEGEPKAESEPKAGDEPKKTETPEETIKRLKDEIRARDGRHGRELQALKDELLAAQRKQATERDAEEAEPSRRPAPPEPESETIPEPTDAQLKAEFGDDYADVIGADYAKRMWMTMEKRSRADRRRIKELVAENAQKVEQERSAATRIDKLFADVEAECPGAGDLNAGAKVNGFGEHLDGYFGETGFTRRQMATMAIDAIKAGATGAEYAAHKKTLVSIFKGFSSAGDGAPPTTQPQGDKPNTDKPDPKLYVQPRLAGGDAAPKRGETITQAEAERMLDEAASKGPAEFEKARRLISRKAAAGEIR